jgi:hypothetical protein
LCLFEIELGFLILWMGWGDVVSNENSTSKFKFLNFNCKIIKIKMLKISNQQKYFS